MISVPAIRRCHNCKTRSRHIESGSVIHRRARKRRESEVLFRAMVSMAHALNMTMVAEGVETAEQLQLLQELGCDEVQGFFISRPLPPAELPALMRKRYMLA